MIGFDWKIDLDCNRMGQVQRDYGVPNFMIRRREFDENGRLRGWKMDDRSNCRSQGDAQQVY